MESNNIESRNDMDSNIMAKVIVCCVACICVTVLGALEIVAGSSCVGVISASLGFIFGRITTK
jgi:hypothetical protein